MELRKEAYSKRDRKGVLRRFVIFWCSFCKSEVIRELYSGKIYASCGCNGGSKTHGGTKTRLYTIWKSMKARILNPKRAAYKDYGGRGITICPEWAESYIVFRDWALSNGYADNLEIDRINTDGNYEPSNCHFVTTKENMRKTRRIKLSLEKRKEIIENYKSGLFSMRELGKKYDVSNGYISDIINNKNKTWIDDK